MREGVLGGGDLIPAEPFVCPLRASCILIMHATFVIATRRRRHGRWRRVWGRRRRRRRTWGRRRGRWVRRERWWRVQWCVGRNGWRGRRWQRRGRWRRNTKGAGRADSTARRADELVAPRSARGFEVDLLRCPPRAHRCRIRGAGDAHEDAQHRRCCVWGARHLRACRPSHVGGRARRGRASSSSPGFKKNKAVTISFW